MDRNKQILNVIKTSKNIIEMEANQWNQLLKSTKRLKILVNAWKYWKIILRQNFLRIFRVDCKITENDSNYNNLDFLKKIIMG